MVAAEGAREVTEQELCDWCGGLADACRYYCDFIVEDGEPMLRRNLHIVCAAADFWMKSAPNFDTRRK